MKRVSKKAVMRFLEKAKDKRTSWSEIDDMLVELLQAKAKDIRKNGNSYLPRITELYILFVGENPNSDTTDGFVYWLHDHIREDFFYWLFLGPETRWESESLLGKFCIENGWTDPEIDWHPFFLVPPTKGAMIDFLKHWVADEGEEERLQFLEFVKKEDKNLWKFLVDDNVEEDEWYDEEVNTCQK